MTPSALIVIVIVIGLLANAALIYVALSRLHEARETGPSRRPSARARRDAAGPIAGSIHREWHRPGAPSTVPQVARRRGSRETDRTASVEDRPEADEDRALAEAIAEFVRSARASGRSAARATAGTDGDEDVVDAEVVPEPALEPVPVRPRGGHASIVVVDVQAGSGRSGLGEPREIDLSVARALRRTARDADEVRRLGDASFAVLLAGTRGPGADAFVSRARRALADALAAYRGSTFSIAAEDVADDPDEALQRALQSLDAKRDERPRRGRPVSP